MKGTVNYLITDLNPRAACMFKEADAADLKDKRIEKIVKDKNTPSSDIFF